MSRMRLPNDNATMQSFNDANELVEDMRKGKEMFATGAVSFVNDYTTTNYYNSTTTSAYYNTTTTQSYYYTTTIINYYNSTTVSGGSASGLTYYGTTALGGAAASIDFTSLTNKNYKIEAILKCNSAETTWVEIMCNGDNGTNYPFTYIKGDGSTAAASGQSGIKGLSGALITNEITYVGGTIYKPAAGTKGSGIFFKGAPGGSTDHDVECVASEWNSTSATINRLTFRLNSGNNLASGSSVTLWGFD